MRDRELCSTAQQTGGIAEGTRLGRRGGWALVEVMNRGLVGPAQDGCQKIMRHHHKRREPYGQTAPHKGRCGTWNLECHPSLCVCVCVFLIAINLKLFMFLFLAYMEHF